MLNFDTKINLDEFYFLLMLFVVFGLMNNTLIHHCLGLG